MGVLLYQYFITKKARNFLKHLVYVGEHEPGARCEYPELGRKLYEYQKPTTVSTKTVLATDQDWSMPETYYKSIGSTIRGLSFLFLFTLSRPTRRIFYPGQKNILKSTIMCHKNISQIKAIFCMIKAT